VCIYTHTHTHTHTHSNIPLNAQDLFLEHIYIHTQVLFGFEFWCCHCWWRSIAETCSRSDCFGYILYRRIVGFIILSILRRTYINTILLLPRNLVPTNFFFAIFVLKEKVYTCSSITPETTICCTKEAEFCFTYAKCYIKRKFSNSVAQTSKICTSPNSITKSVQFLWVHPK
jgi:hypothetical protein